MFFCFAGNSIVWKSRRPRKRRAKSRRRKAKKNTRKGMKAATVRLIPPVVAAVAVIATRIQKVRASPRAKRKRRTREKIPVGITAQRVSGKSRVRKGPLLTGAGHGAFTLDRGDLKRSLEIVDKQGQRGEGAGVAAVALRVGWREAWREEGPTAGTGRDLAASSLASKEVEAVREVGMMEVKTNVTVEMVRGTEVAQKERETEQQTGGAGAERGGEKG